MDRELSPRDRHLDRARRWAVPAAALLGLAALLLTLPAWMAPGIDRDRLRLGIVERGTLEVSIRAAGTVEPLSERVLTSPVASRLLRVLQQPGSRLQAGDQLLELDLSPARLEQEQLQSRWVQASLRLRELAAEEEKTIAKLAATAEIKALELEEAEIRRRQDQELFEAGLQSETALLQSKTRTRRLEIELRSLRQDLEHTRASGKAKTDRLEAEIRSLADVRRQGEQELERASTRVLTPGVLTYVLSQEGVEVRPGDVLARIADLDRYRVAGTVSDVHADRLEIGQLVRLELPGSKGKSSGSLSGRVQNILPAVQDGALRFWVEIEEPKSDAGTESRPTSPAGTSPPHDDSPFSRLRPSSRVDVLVITDILENTLVLPEGPFARGPGEQEVFVLDPEGQIARRRTAVLGPSGQRRLQIVRGLEEGETVILSDMSDFREIEEIKIR